MTDIWVCGNCHSLNRQRSKRCYKCGADQVVAATDQGVTHRQEEAIAIRAVVAYRSSSALAFATSIFLLLLAGIAVGQVVLEIGAYPAVVHEIDRIAAGERPDPSVAIEWGGAALPLLAANVGVVIFTLLFFAAWLSRVVSNVPALGGGIPTTTPARAFRNTLIPIVNLWTVPGMVTDVLYRLDPTGGGLFMVGVAWLGLVGSWVISFFAGWYLNLRLQFDAFNAASLDEFVESVHGLLPVGLAIDVVCGLLIAAGSVVLILVIVRIERRSRNRDAEVRAVAGALE
jgi:Domain of unknown function (DUF4328)